MRRIFIMGDIHGQVGRIKEFCQREETSINDILILLGDVGLNYNLNEYDKQRKLYISKLPITVICLHGNHEERPYLIDSYIREYNDDLKCSVWYEPTYPNILFPEDGVITIKGLRCLFLGGAYSVDKYYRLERNLSWFSSEQMSTETMENISQEIKDNNKFDYVFSHTAPISEEPRYLFLNMIDQDTVDKTMEKFLEQVKNQIEFKHWYFGHYHDDKQLNDKFTILYQNYLKLSEKGEYNG